MKAVLISLIYNIIFFGFTAYAQPDSSVNNNYLKMQDVFDLAVRNSVQLKISAKNIELAHQKIQVVKLSQLPGISTGLNYGYVSNSQIWDPSFSEHKTAQIPHHLTQLSVQASQTIFKGGEINNNIAKASLEEQIAFLNLEKNSTDIKFLVAARYLEIYQLINQRKVFVNNIKLSQQRLNNILVMQKQGMVTNNDVLRTQLIISDLELATRRTDNNITILNQQLNMVIGLDVSSQLLPDSMLLKADFNDERLDSFLDDSYNYNRELKLAAADTRVAETNVRLLNAEKYPEVSVFAGSNFQRPYVNVMPAIDIYYNVWQTGVSIRYNISSIYQSPRKIKSGKIVQQQTLQKQTLQKQNVELAVNASYIKYREAKDDLVTYRRDLISAEENYRIVEKKYFNQLALLTDMIDATNTKVEAEIKVSNAEISVVYTYYQLLKSTGKL